MRAAILRDARRAALLTMRHQGCFHRHSQISCRLRPHPEDHREAMRLEGWPRALMVRDARAARAPHHEAARDASMRRRSDPFQMRGWLSLEKAVSLTPCRPASHPLRPLIRPSCCRTCFRRWFAAAAGPARAPAGAAGKGPRRPLRAVDRADRRRQDAGRILPTLVELSS